MRRKILFIILLPLLMVACKTLPPGTAPRSEAPGTLTPRPTVTDSLTLQAELTPNSTVTASLPPQATPTSRPADAASLYAVRGSGSTFVRLKPADGKLPDLLAAEAKKAAALGQLPAVEFDSTCCPACKDIASGLDAQDAGLVNALDGVYLIRLNTDDWGWNMQKDGFSFNGIPVFFKLDSQGRPNGEFIDGKAWRESVPAKVAPPLDEFFHGK